MLIASSASVLVSDSAISASALFGIWEPSVEVEIDGIWEKHQTLDEIETESVVEQGTGSAIFPEEVQIGWCSTDSEETDQQCSQSIEPEPL